MLAGCFPLVIRKFPCLYRVKNIDIYKKYSYKFYFSNRVPICSPSLHRLWYFCRTTCILFWANISALSGNLHWMAWGGIVERHGGSSISSDGEIWADLGFSHFWKIFSRLFFFEKNFDNPSCVSIVYIPHLDNVLDCRRYYFSSIIKIVATRSFLVILKICFQQFFWKFIEFFWFRKISS